MSYALPLFVAGFAYSEDNEESQTVGLADSPIETKKYILIQKVKHPTESDQRLGLTGIYLEVNDQIHSSYRGVQRILLFTDRLEVILFDKMAGSMKLPIHFSIEFSSDMLGASEFADALLGLDAAIVYDKR